VVKYSFPEYDDDLITTVHPHPGKTLVARQDATLPDIITPAD
jgi:hypothetical protein